MSARHKRTGERLREIAKRNERLADIAEALEPTFGEVEFSPLSAWEIQVGEDALGNPVALPLAEYVRLFNKPAAADEPAGYLRHAELCAWRFGGRCDCRDGQGAHRR